MKNKLLVMLVAFTLIFNLPIKASEVENQTPIPSWVDVKYANVYNESVSEYQLVTVTASNYGLWFANNNYDINVDYDPSQLKLANTYYTDSMQNKSVKSGSSVHTEDNNFAVSFQFYLQPNVDLTSVPITITKDKNGSKSQSATIDLKAYSDTTLRLLQVGNVGLRYNVTTYSNDGTNIEYNIHFIVDSNPHREELTLSLKKNNMTVSSSDNYQAKLRYSGGKATAIDKNNFSLKLNEGNTFDLNITAPVEALSAKDDRFDFFIYLQNGDQFVRLSPMYYRSELVTDSINTRAIKYIYIIMTIIGFFIFLTSLYLLTNRKKKIKAKK